MIPRYPNITSLESALVEQGYSINANATTSSTIVTNANSKNQTELNVTLDPVTKVPNPQPKSSRWQRIPRVGKRKRN